MISQRHTFQHAQCDHKVSHFNTLISPTKSFVSARSSMQQRLTIQRAQPDHKVLYFSASRSLATHRLRNHHDHAMHMGSLSSSRSDTTQRQPGNHAQKQHGQWLRHVLVRNIVTLHNTITASTTSFKSSRSLLSHGLTTMHGLYFHIVSKNAPFFCHTSSFPKTPRSIVAHRRILERGHTSHIAGNDTTLCISQCHIL